MAIKKKRVSQLSFLASPAVLKNSGKHRLKMEDVGGSMIRRLQFILMSSSKGNYWLTK